MIEEKSSQKRKQVLKNYQVCFLRRLRINLGKGSGLANANFYSNRPLNKISRSEESCLLQKSLEENENTILWKPVKANLIGKILQEKRRLFVDAEEKAFEKGNKWHEFIRYEFFRNSRLTLKKDCGLQMVISFRRSSSQNLKTHTKFFVAKSFSRKQAMPCAKESIWFP